MSYMDNDDTFIPLTREDLDAYEDFLESTRYLHNPTTFGDDEYDTYEDDIEQQIIDTLTWDASDFGDNYYYDDV